MTDDRDRKLTDAYRSARRVLLGVAGVGMAWGSAQLDPTAMELPFLGAMKLQSTFVPALLAVALAYFALRLVIEYCMMPFAIRRWRLAQFDFMTTTYVVEISALIVAAGVAKRAMLNAAQAVTTVAVFGIMVIAIEKIHVQRRLFYSLMDALAKLFRIPHSEEFLARRDARARTIDAKLKQFMRLVLTCYLAATPILLWILSKFVMSQPAKLGDYCLIAAFASFGNLHLWADKWRVRLFLKPEMRDQIESH